jgi:hypothetical protein
MARIPRLGISTARVIAFAAFVLVLGVAEQSAAQTGNEPRVWLVISVRSRPASDSSWRWTADSLVRTRNGASTMDFVGEWLSMTRDVTRRSSLGVSYAYGAAFPDGGRVGEHRLAQHYGWSAGSAWNIALRTRLEERFIQHQSSTQVQASQFVRASWPLGARGTLRGVSSDEIFLRLNATARGSRGLDSNRVFVGLQKKLTPRNAVEAGYLNVYARGTSGRGQRSHVVSITLLTTL